MDNSGTHKLGVGVRVETENGCRLFIEHKYFGFTGSPLYGLSMEPGAGACSWEWREEFLKVVPVDPKVTRAEVFCVVHDHAYDFLTSSHRLEGDTIRGLLAKALTDKVVTIGEITDHWHKILEEELS